MMMSVSNIVPMAYLSQQISYLMTVVIVTLDCICRGISAV